jgi:pyruvate dehydrogenase E1 component
MYRYKASSNKRKKYKAHLFGSGAILNEALKAQEILEDDYGVAADVWSVTSYKELYHDAITVARNNMLSTNNKAETSYIEKTLADEQGVFVAASDYLKAVPGSIGQWMPDPFVVLGTDGFGRSDSRTGLRDFFEVDARHIVIAALSAMAVENKIKPGVVKKAVKDLEIDPDKLDPLTS